LSDSEGVNAALEFDRSVAKASRKIVRNGLGGVKGQPTRFGLSYENFRSSIDTRAPMVISRRSARGAVT
jgi:hypothetical protein